MRTTHHVSATRDLEGFTSEVIVIRVISHIVYAKWVNKHVGRRLVCAKLTTWPSVCALGIAVLFWLRSRLLSLLELTTVFAHCLLCIVPGAFAMRCAVASLLANIQMFSCPT